MFRPIGGTRDWGSAVYVRELPARQVTVGGHEGWVLGAVVAIGESEITFVSVHAKKDEGIGHGYGRPYKVFPNLDNIFRSMLPMIEKTGVVVGGDLNSGRGFDEYYSIRNPKLRHSSFFDRVEESGLYDCHRLFHEADEQTYFRYNVHWAIQDDHLFVDGRLRGLVKSCDVLDNVETRRLSDHAPLVMELALERGFAQG
jgi:exonuclease III